jgi:hypothetical protein
LKTNGVRFGGSVISLVGEQKVQGLKDHVAVEDWNFLFLGKIQFTPLKFLGIFNLNPKVSKLTVYSLEVLKSSKVNLLLTFSSN